MEVISTIIAIFSAILIVGIVVDAFSRGLDNLSYWEGFVFFIAIFALIIIIL